MRAEFYGCTSGKDIPWNPIAPLPSPVHSPLPWTACTWPPCLVPIVDSAPPLPPQQPKITNKSFVCSRTAQCYKLVIKNTVISWSYRIFVILFPTTIADLLQLAMSMFNHNVESPHWWYPLPCVPFPLPERPFTIDHWKNGSLPQYRSFISRIIPENYGIWNKGFSFFMSFWCDVVWHSVVCCSVLWYALV